jgi:hypothetical protein
MVGSDQAGCVQAGSVHTGAEGVHSHWRALRSVSTLGPRDTTVLMYAIMTVTFVGSDVEAEGGTGAAETADALIRAKARKGRSIFGADADV